MQGSVTVLLADDQGHELVLAYLKPGEFFGEIGLFSEQRGRSALVRAVPLVRLRQSATPNCASWASSILG